jgi:hypothetical protein
MWTDFGPPGVPRFTAKETLTLANGPTPAEVTLAQSLQITNPGASPLSISVFELAVPDPNGSNTGYSASGGPNAMTVAAGGTGVTLSAVGASAYQAATDPSLGNLLYGGPAADLNDTGLPISGYTPHPYLISLAYEWTATIPAGGSQTFSSAITVPEPNSFALAALAAALSATAVRRWRVRRPVRSG